MRTALLFALAVIAGCGTDEPDTEGPLSPAPPEGGQQLATSTWRVQPGEEKYICFQFYSPDEPVAITRVDEIASLGVHHFLLFQAFGRNEPDAPHECPALIKTTWNPIYAAATGEGHALQTPPGTGFVIAPATQYIVQLHIQNTSDDPMDVRGGLNLTYERDVSAITPVGIYGIGSFAVDIPANTQKFEVPVNCTMQKTMNVFGVLPHMHKLGTKIDVQHTPVSGEKKSFYKIDPWLFGNQPLDMMNETITPGDKLDVTCTYNNPTNQSVKYGESSDEEMCFFLLFYYPYDHLDGCAVGG